MGFLDVCLPRAAVCAVCAALTACATLPDLEETVPPDIETADYPDLIPVRQLLRTMPLDPDTDEETAQRLEARAAGLQARAVGLQRRNSIEPEARDRLERGIDTGLPQD